MKRMRMLVATATMVCAVSAIAADRFEKTITVAAGATSGTATMELFKADGPPCSTIDTVYAVVDSGAGTGTVVFATYDYGVATTIATSTAIRYGGGAYATQPYNTLSALYTYPVVQNIVTGEVVLAMLNLQTNYAVSVTSPIARQVKVTVTQLAVATDTVYDVAVYVKENPPPIKK